MTENQRKLVLLIHYRLANGVIPSVTEMMDGIGALNNKSVFRAIESLTKQGYLVQVGEKISNVIPTDKARNELMLNQLRPYCPSIQPINMLKQENKFPIGATQGTTNFIGPLGADIKIDGTTFNSSEIKTIVQSVVNMALSEKFHNDGTLNNLLKFLPRIEESKWIIYGISLLIVSVILFGKEHLAIGATCFILFTIFIITFIINVKK